MSEEDIGMIKLISWKRKSAIIKQNQEIERLRDLLAETVRVLVTLNYKPTSIQLLLDKLVEESNNGNRRSQSSRDSS